MIGGGSVMVVFETVDALLAVACFLLWSAFIGFIVLFNW